MFLEGDALHAIAGFSLTNDNYKEALKLLKSRFGNMQQIIAAHMNVLVKMSSVNNEELSGLRGFLMTLHHTLEVWLILEWKAELMDRYCVQLYLKSPQMN